VYEAAWMLQGKGISQGTFIEGGVSVGSAYFK